MHGLARISQAWPTKHSQLDLLGVLGACMHATKSRHAGRSKACEAGMQLREERCCRGTHLQRVIDFGSQAIKVGQRDELALDELHAPAAFPHSCCCLALAVQQIHAKRCW